MQRARNSLQRLAATILSTAPPDDAVLFGWPLVCGTSVAGRTEAAEFSDGKLTVLVPDKIWRNQLEGFSRQYLANLNSMVKAEVKEIRFVVASEKRASDLRAIEQKKYEERKGKRAAREG